MQNTKNLNTLPEPKPRYRLTKIGEQMARLPIDPKVARILLAAKKHDCMAEILVIVSALSIQDPRERPLEAREAASKAHERFADKQSDFLAYLNIWDSFQRERDKGLSNKQLVQWCRQYFLSHLRMREWRELHHQLAQTAIEMGLTTKEAAFRRPPEAKQLTSSENAGDQDLSVKLKQKQLDKKQHRAQIRAAKEAGYEQIHRALLTGLIANVGMKSPDGNDYTGARGSRFHLFPASALFKSKPKWVMAAELTETTRLYARDVAAIQPEWIEQEAPHLVKYHYFEPHWEQKRGEVVASERVTLYGLTVLPRRPVAYGRIAPAESREIFIRSALVAQECDLKADFFFHNKKLIKEITELEHKSRKQDVLVDDEALFAFYNERLPDFYTADAVSDGLHTESSLHPRRLPENQHACFPAGTLVHTDKGPVPIEHIRVGDHVLSRSEYGGTDAPTAYKTVLRAFCSGESTLVRLMLCSDNQDSKHPSPVYQALMTANHPLWDTVLQKWRPAAELEKGTLLACANGNTLRVLSLEHFEKSTTDTVIYNHRLTVSGTEIAYYSVGNTAGRPILLLHGGGVDSALLSWQEVMQKWQDDDYYLIAPDWPGYGASEKPNVNYSIDYYEQFLNQLITSLNLSNPILCGLSMGGAVALQYALHHPQQVEKLVLLAPWGISRSAPLSGIGKWYAKSRLNRLSYRLCASRWLTRYLIATTLIGDPQRITPETVDSVRAAALDKDAGKAFQSFQINEIGDSQQIGRLLPQLPSLSMPVLLVHGENDPGVPLSDAQAAASSIPNSRLEVFGQHKHWAQKESPQRFADLLRDFCCHEQPSSAVSRVPVYNLEVEDFHTYFIGEQAIWVHNCDMQIQPEKILSDAPKPEPLPEYCRPKIRIADDAEQRDRLCRLLVAQNQHDLATWAMQCVQHILPLLPDAVEADAVHDAFDLLKRWQNGQADVAQLRQTGFALHKLAKEQQNPVATAVLRAAGQAVGVGHMKEHAPVCGDYAVKAVGLANGQNPQAVSQERQWQLEQLQQIAAQPSSLHPERLPENTTGTLSDNLKPKKQPAPQKGRLKPNIRPAANSDAAALAELFCRAVKHISNSHYSEQEKNAWLQGADDAEFWQQRIDSGNVRVATHNGRMLGFIEYQPEQSHLNCLFTDPSHQRQGIATALLAAVLPSADSGTAVSADVSKAAAAFFQNQGFVLQHENQIPRNGTVLTNYCMVRQADSLKAQKQPENVGRILESDKTFDAAQTSDTSIRPTRLSGSLKPQTPSEKPLADIRTFAAWLKTAERDNPRLLFLSRDDLMQHAAAHITEEQFPKHWQTADGKFKLSYRFEPHHPLDGVTLTLPLTVLNRISPAALEWLVPGMIREKIQLQIKALPKQIRRICVPVPEFITQFLSQNPDRNAPILPQLAQAIAKTAGDIRILEHINQDEWAAFRLPEHCYFNLRIIDDGGQELAMGRDLIQIQQQLGKAAATTFRDNTQEFERDNVTAWDIGTLPESIKFARGKQQLTGYLGLQKEKVGRIALRLFDTSAAAEQAHRLGVIELMKLQLKEQVKDLNKGIQGFTQAAMLLKHINADTLRDDLTQAVCDRAFIGEDELPRNEKAFKEQIKRARSRLPAVKEALSRYLQETAAAYAELNSKLGKHPLTHLMRQRLQTLLAPGFATRTPWAQWPRLPIYLKAMTLRLEKYSSNPTRDAAREADIQELEQMWQEKTDSLVKQGQPASDDLAAFRWMIEELRVSLFAQELKTPYPVSVKRLLKEWDNIKLTY
nr:alpha/beta fold hydrolase [Neisseria sp. KEM232]